MTTVRIIYRTHQFLNAMGSAPQVADLALVESILTPPLLALFLQLKGNEQAHGLRVLKRLSEAGHTHPDLQIAALLHDVGKSRFSLSLGGRILIVLAHHLAPKSVKAWGDCEPKGWKQVFVIAEKHPAWGAEMVRQAGASPLVVNLILHHQDHVHNDHISSIESRLLRLLQSADNES